MNGERREAVLGRLELFRALAEEKEREQQVGSLTAYTYPQSLGEWLGTGASCCVVGRRALRRRRGAMRLRARRRHRD